MGYITDFEGEFKLSPPMQPKHTAYLNAFSASRRVSRAPNNVRIEIDHDECIPVCTLEDALHEATMPFPAHDALVRFDECSYRSMADMAALVESLPAYQRSTRRFIVEIDDVTEHSTGAVVSKFSTVEMVPLNTAVLSNGDALVNRDTTIFLLAVESIEFLRSDGCLGAMQRCVRLRWTKMA